MNNAIDMALAHEFSEAHTENLVALNTLLPKLQAGPTSQELLTAFIHGLRNIEGGAGFHQFTQLESVCQKGSLLISRLLRQELSFDNTTYLYLTTLLALIKEALAAIKNEFLEINIDQSKLTALTAKINGGMPNGHQTETMISPKKDPVVTISEAIIELDAVNELSDAKALYEKIHLSVKNNLEIIGNAAAVAKIDVSILQLLATYNIDAKKNSSTFVICKNPSSEFVKFAKLLNLESHILSL